MAYSLAMCQAISIIIYIASKMEENKSEFLTTKMMSEKLGLAVPTAVKILNSLNAARITMTKEGAKGGILLAKPPEEITLLDIFLTLEQDRPLFKTDFNLNTHCEHLDIFKGNVQGCLGDAEKELKRYLQRITIRDLMK